MTVTAKINILTLVIPQILPSIIIILFFFLSLFTYTTLAGPIPFSVSQVTTNKSDAFAVTGEGRVSVKSDSATVRVGVSADGSTAKIAQDKMNENINKVVSAIKALGIEEKDIKTDNYSVYPNFDNAPKPAIAPAQPDTVVDSRASSFAANTNIQVIVKDSDMANKVLDTATQNGANQIGGVEFSTKDQTEAQNEARKKAVEDAKKKAEDAAEIAGFKLGKIINYQENFGGGYPMPYSVGRAENAKDSAPTQVQAGENEVVVSVTLSYEIR